MKMYQIPKHIIVPERRLLFYSLLLGFDNQLTWIINLRDTLIRLVGVHLTLKEETDVLVLLFPWIISLHYTQKCIMKKLKFSNPAFVNVRERLNMMHPLWRTMVNFPLILLNAELKVQVCVWAKVALFWCSEKTLQNIVMQLHWWQMNELEEIPAGSYGLGCFQVQG